MFPGSEIYGGLANSWDLGHLGNELFNNIASLWWKKFVQERDDMVGVRGPVIMNPKVWEASGHLAGFTDPMVECRVCHARFRTDHLIKKDGKMSAIESELTLFLHANDLDRGISEAKWKANPVDSIVGFFEYLLEKSEYSGREKEKILRYIKKAAKEAFDSIDYDISINEDGYYEGGSDFSKKFFDRFNIKNVGDLVDEIYLDREVKCPVCEKRDWGVPSQFNLLFKTFIGSTEDSAATAYLRGELAQTMFTDFKTVVETTRKRLPFGIAQIGKAFRNEITTGNFLFRTKEFTIAELEYFV